MPRIYSKPPVVEAVCEFRFIGPAEPWDWTIPGLLYERVKETFPVKMEVRSVEVTVSQGAGQAVQQNVQTKMQFQSKSKTEILQVGRDLFSVNQLRPYPKWSTFKTLISDQLKLYRRVANPLRLSRIGLRYVNRIEIPRQTIELEDFFRIQTQVPQPIPQTFQAFVSQIEIPYEKQKISLRLAFGNAPPEDQDHLAFLLDLDMFSVENQTPHLDQVPSWLEKAHDQLEAAFEAAFTEKTHKEIFQEVNS